MAERVFGFETKVNDSGLTAVVWPISPQPLLVWRANDFPYALVRTKMYLLINFDLRLQQDPEISHHVIWSRDGSLDKALIEAEIAKNVSLDTTETMWFQVQKIVKFKNSFTLLELG